MRLSSRVMKCVSCVWQTSVDEGLLSVADIEKPIRTSKGTVSGLFVYCVTVTGTTAHIASIVLMGSLAINKQTNKPEMVHLMLSLSFSE